MRRDPAALAERAREGQLVAVGVREVEVALAPLGVPGRRFGGEPGGEGPGMERVHVVDVEDRSVPTTPTARPAAPR